MGMLLKLTVWGRAWCLLVAMIAVFAAPQAAWAMDFDQSVTLAIQPQPLVSALNAFSQQARVQVMSAGVDLKDRQAPGIDGSYAIGKALDLLLAGSGLTYKEAGPNTVTIAAAPTVSGNAPEVVSQAGNVNAGVALQSAGVEPAPNGSSPQGGRSDQGSQALETVVVTAQKREQRLIDVPISIVALNADALKKREISSIDDLALAVPGLAIYSSGNERRIEIRGISNLFGSSSPNVGVYLDEADVTGANSLQPDIGTYDMQRVEVLRGPQGTLYGEGSAGGTIHFVTKNPALNKFSFDSDVAALFTQNGAPSQRILDVINVPIIQDELALRVAGSFDHEGGWINQPDADQTAINYQNRTDVRAKLLWEPTDKLTVNTMALIYRNDQGLNYGEDANGNYTQAFGLTTTPHFKSDYEILNSTVSYDFSAARLLSTTTFSRQNQTQIDVGSFLQETAPGTPGDSAYLAPYNTGSHSLINELRLSSSGSGPWQWTIGTYYKYARAAYGFLNDYFATTGSPLPAPAVLQGRAVLGCCGTDRSGSIYGDTNYKLFDLLTLGVGVRYFEDKPLGGESACCTATSPLTANPAANSHSLDPRFYADYKVADPFHIYASAAKGFRSGGTNSFNQPQYGPESVWTYETGAKMSLLGGRLSADGDVFYSDYKNYQIVGILPPPLPALNVVSNGGDARIEGVEWDLNWRPIEHWTLGFNGNLITTRFYKIDVTSDAYNVGDGLDLIPKHTFTVSAERDFTWNGKNAYVRLDYSQQGHETFRNRSIGPWYYSESDDINMLNFNSSLQWNEHLSLGVFAKNLLNDRGLMAPGNAATETDVEVRPQPRTYGLQVSMKFD